MKNIYNKLSLYLGKKVGLFVIVHIRTKDTVVVF